MTPVIRSVNVADPSAGQRTGIDKLPVASIEVFAPAPGHGNGSGVAGDHVGNAKHHGGADKAVYAYAREELDVWAQELGRELRDGTFGENLTTAGIDLEGLLINQRLRIGEVVLEVSIPRSPCRTFSTHLGEPGWVKRFTARGRCGVYLRVIEPGTIDVGDSIEVLPAPGHDIDMLTAFAATMGDKEAAARVVAAECLPAEYHDGLVKRLAR